MSKPESVKIDPWTEFPRQSFSLLTDDFVHDKLFTLKVNSKGEKSTVNFKANVKGEKGAFKLSDEIKFWFNLPGGRSFYSKVKSGDSMKLHFDNGIIEKHSKKINLYATLNLTKTLTNASLRLGAAHKGEHCNSDNRLKIDFTSDNKSNLTWYNRTVVTKDKFTFGSMLVYGISSKVLSKSNFLLGYKVNDKVDAFLRVENNTFRTSQFKLNEIISHLDSYKVDVIAKHDKNIKYGLETVFKQKAGKSPFEEALMVVQHENKETDKTCKVRISSKFDVSVAYKQPCSIFKDIATVTIGAHGSNLQNDKRTFKAGAQIEFNV